MTIGKRIYWVVALVAVLTLAGAAVTLTVSLTSAGPTAAPAAQSCDEQNDDAAAENAAEVQDTDDIEQECGDQNEADDANEAEDGDIQASSGTLDDGKDLLPQASITLDQAIAAAQTAASGDLGEIDLEHYQGKLVFNVDIGDKDVKVDASSGSILAAESDD
jgi:uncharacterized membrane protein YkoI